MKVQIDTVSNQPDLIMGWPPGGWTFEPCGQALKPYTSHIRVPGESLTGAHKVWYAVKYSTGIPEFLEAEPDPNMQYGGTTLAGWLYPGPDINKKSWESIRAMNRFLKQDIWTATLADDDGIIDQKNDCIGPMEAWTWAARQAHGMGATC